MTRKIAQTERHLSWEFLSERIKGGTPSREQIQGTPQCDLILEARGRRLALVVTGAPAKDERLPFFASVECVRVGTGARSYVQLSCTDRERYQEFYAFVTAVADRVQLQGMPVDEAIADAADSVRDLLAGGTALPLERQLGLWGELWAVEALAERTTWKTAVQAWIANGDSPEEHDFALATLDIEVKTTNAELRRHHISSASQLTPKHDRPLFVLSLQITAGGAGGTTLADAVAKVRAAAVKSVAVKLEKTLKAVGWRDEDADRYSTRWVHRSAPIAFNATELPRLKVEGSNPHRLVSWTYVVDVSGLGESATGEWKWLR
ncbi:MAG: PD-(D/E)XK motif protein [Myxococcaceae bacterium]|nr:PD-(D/E)XK motif protein [Myxococcaceae bacterium]